MTRPLPLIGLCVLLAVVPFPRPVASGSSGLPGLKWEEVPSPFPAVLANISQAATVYVPAQGLLLFAGGLDYATTSSTTAVWAAQVVKVAIEGHTQVVVSNWTLRGTLPVPAFNGQLAQMDGSLVRVGGWCGPNIFTVCRTVMVSHDLGASWAVTTQSAPWSAQAGLPVTMVDLNTQSVVVIEQPTGPASSARMFISTDNGRTWASLSAFPRSSTGLLVVAAAPASDGAWLLYTENSAGLGPSSVVWSSRDHGASWSMVGVCSFPVGGMTTPFFVASASRMYSVDDSGLKVLVSGDGVVWSLLPGLPGGRSVSAVVPVGTTGALVFTSLPPQATPGLFWGSVDPTAPPSTAPGPVFPRVYASFSPSRDAQGMVKVAQGSVVKVASAMLLGSTFGSRVHNCFLSFNLSVPGFGAAQCTGGGFLNNNVQVDCELPTAGASAYGVPFNITARVFASATADAQWQVYSSRLGQVVVKRAWSSNGQHRLTVISLTAVGALAVCGVMWILCSRWQAPARDCAEYPPLVLQATDRSPGFKSYVVPSE